MDIVAVSGIGTEEAARGDADAVRLRAEVAILRLQRDVRPLDVTAGLARLRRHLHSLVCGQDDIAVTADRLYGQRRMRILLDMDVAVRIRIKHAAHVDQQGGVHRTDAVDAAGAAVQGKVFRRDCLAGAIDALRPLQVDIPVGRDFAEAQRTVLAGNIDMLIALQIYIAHQSYIVGITSRLHLDGTCMRDFHAVRRPVHLSRTCVRERNEILLFEEIGVCNADLATVLADAPAGSRREADRTPDDVRCLDLRHLSRLRIDSTLLDGVAQTAHAPTVAVALLERLVVADKGAYILRQGTSILCKERILRRADGPRIGSLHRPARVMRGFQFGKIVRARLLDPLIREVCLGETQIALIELLHLGIRRLRTAHRARGCLTKTLQTIEPFLLCRSSRFCTLIGLVARIRQPQRTPAFHTLRCVGEFALLGQGVDDSAFCRQRYAALFAFNPADPHVARILVGQINVILCRRVHAAACQYGKVDCPFLTRKGDVVAPHGSLMVCPHPPYAAARMNGGIHQGACLDDLQSAALRSEVDCPIPRIQIKFRGVRCIGCALMQLDACSGNHIQVVRVDDAVLFEIAFNPAPIRVQIDSICAVRDVADGTVEDEIAACMHVHFAARIPVHIAARHVHIVLVVAPGELHVDPIACGDPVGVARPLRRDLVPLMEVNAVLKGSPPPFVDHVWRAVTVIDTFPVFLLPFSIVLGDGRRIRENLLGLGLIFVSVHAIVLAIHISRAEIDTVRQDVPLRRRHTDTHRAIFNILLGDIGADIARCPMTVGKEALPVGVALLCLRAAPAARPVVGQIFFRIIVRIERFAAAPLRSLFECTLIRLLCADGVGAVGTVAQILGCLARIPVIEGNPAAARAVRNRPQMKVTRQPGGGYVDV